ncbi:FecCD family ABC transporter permease [Desulfurella sp.]|uniref:FecCD family ABC transporter permease n=1 Tax=Desulfurella sp. TaxID=1962857 RepID=UPI003D127D78
MKNTILIVLSFVVIVVSLGVGPYKIAPIDVVKCFFNPKASIDPTIVLDIRLPRVLFAYFVGAGLSAAGSAYQAMFKNPLVSPDILGVSGGAAFGAALAILTLNHFYFIEIFAFVFGTIAVYIAFFLAKSKQELPVLNLVISGIIVGSFFTALLGIIKYLADPNNQLPQIVFWLMGSFANVSFSAWGAFIIIGICVVFLYLLRWQLNIAAFGDDEAKSLGVNIINLRKIIILLSTLTTAASVAVVGIIGWVGLIIPHISRLISGSDNRNVMPTSIFVGGIFMVIIDDLARSLISGEIPVGILTSLLGAPFFAWLYKKQKRL